MNQRYKTHDNRLLRFLAMIHRRLWNLVSGQVW